MEGLAVFDKRGKGSTKVGEEANQGAEPRARVPRGLGNWDVWRA